MLLVLRLPGRGLRQKRYQIIHASVLNRYYLCGHPCVLHRHCRINRAPRIGEAGKFFYVLKKPEHKVAPMSPGFIPGALVPGQMPRALRISFQEAFVFPRDPIRAGLSIVAALALIAVVLLSLRKSRNVAWTEKDPRRRSHVQIAQCPGQPGCRTPIIKRCPVAPGGPETCGLRRKKGRRSRPFY